MRKICFGSLLRTVGKLHRSQSQRSRLVPSSIAHFISQQQVSAKISYQEIDGSRYSTIGTRYYTNTRIYHDNDRKIEYPATLHPLLEDARLCSTSQHLEVDKTHIWHPYTSLLDPPPVLPVSHAKGCTITLEEEAVDDTSSNDSKNIKNVDVPPKLLDGMSSWWAAIWGYNHPVLNHAVTSQLNRMSHVMFGGLTHRPATELATMLLQVMTREGLDNLTKVFYTDSGSVAVEVALKMSLQYHRGTGVPSKKKILSIRGGYHGDTFGAMSVCDPINGMHSAFSGGMLATQVFTTRPPCDPSTRVGDFKNGCQGCTCRGDGYEAALEQSLSDLETTILENHASLAALIVEPIVQGAGGMKFYSPVFLQRARELCTEYNLLLICDEIATGFGRSGGDALFASQAAGVQPDVLCLGKALTGGYMTLGAVLTTDEVARGVSSSPSNNEGSSSEVVPLPLMHGPTFMANPLACSVAVASTNMMIRPTSDIDETPMWKSCVDRIEKELRQNLRLASTIHGVADVRVRGAIGVIEMDSPLNSAWVTKQCQSLGVWLRPFGRLLYCMPPYIMTTQELKKVTNAMLILAEEGGMDATEHVEKSNETDYERNQQQKKLKCHQQ